jgi:hypothetical protein
MYLKHQTDGLQKLTLTCLNDAATKHVSVSLCKPDVKGFLGSELYVV